MIKFCLKLLIFTLLFFAFEAKAEQLPADWAQKLIEREFAGQGIADKVEVEIYGGKTDFGNDCQHEWKYMVSNIKTDDAQNRFSCVIDVFADGEKTDSTIIQGKFYVIADAYIPMVNIAKGEVITSSMLRRTDMRMNKVKPQNIIELDKILGKEAKRQLREGKIINERDIGNIVLIKKGEIVNMVYRTNKMQISAKVQALSDGSEGDKIEVMNVKSKKVLSADVIDRQTVRVDADF